LSFSIFFGIRFIPIRSTCPSQLSLGDLINLTKSSCPSKLSNSAFVLSLHSPCIQTGPHMRRKIFLSNTLRACLSTVLKGHACAT
jgi:hypothetical protein